MPRKKPLKINYMDMKIPFENFRIPKARAEQIKLIERFETEFGKDYRLIEWIDPCDDYTKDMRLRYVHNSLEEKIARIKRRNYYVKLLKKAELDHDEDVIGECNSLRELPPLPGSDNGWNIMPAMYKKYKSNK